MKYPTQLLSIVFLSVALAVPVQAQTPLSPKALGMGGSYVAVARGQQALQFNPANLALPDGPRWSFSLAGLTLGGTAAGPAFQDYGNLVLGEGGDETLLDAVPASGAGIDMDVHLSALNLQIGRFAAGVSYHGTVSQRAPRDVFDLALNGYDDRRTDYRLAGTRMTEADYLDVAAGYGWTLEDVHGDEDVHVGVTAHYLQTRQLAARVFTSDPRYRTTTETDPYDGTTYTSRDFALDYRDLYAEGGSGFALDVGAAWQPAPKWTVSGSVTHLISSTGWGAVHERAETLTAEDASGVLDAGLLLDAAAEEGVPVAEGDPAAQALLDDARLPRTLRVGGAYRPIKYTELGAAYQQQITGGLLAGGGWEHTLGVGVEQYLPFLPIAARAGYVTAFGEGGMFTLGASALGIHAGLARMNYDRDGIAHDHWVATVGVSFSGSYRTPPTQTP